MTIDVDRREFILAVVATAAGGVGAVVGEVPIVHFGMVSDLHYAELPDAIDDPGMRCFKDAPLKLRDCIKVMNERKVDFMIEIGDIKDMMSTKEATLKCLDDIENEFAQFKGPRYHVLGNHETDCITKEEFFAHISNYGQKNAKSYYSFSVGKVTFVVLDANFTSKMEDYRPGNFDFRDTNIPPAQIKWLQGVLASAPGPVVVFAHQLIDPACDDIMRIK